MIYRRGGTCTGALGFRIWVLPAEEGFNPVSPKFGAQRDVGILQVPKEEEGRRKRDDLLEGASDRLRIQSEAPESRIRPRVC